MDEYMNEDLREKPNHAHYPICRGRMGDIESHSHKLFFYTLFACIIMAFLSILCIPMHVIGWIPMIFNSEEISKGAFHVSIGFGFSQVLSCVAIVVIAALNLGKRKACGVILLIIYFALLLSSLLASLTGFDVVTAMISFMGLYYSRCTIKDKRDYEQLSKTEGFPLFNVILAEYDDNKNYQPFLKTKYGTDYFNKANQNNSAPAAPLHEPPKNYYEPDNGLGDMPELNTVSLSGTNAARGRFSPRSGKEGAISFSPLKLK